MKTLSIQVERTCYFCNEIKVEEYCEVCGGKVNYMQSYDVPWDICEAIYRAMAIIGVSDKEGVIT